MRNKRQSRRTFYKSILGGTLLLMLLQAGFYYHLQNKSVRMFDSDTDSITLMRLQSILGKKASIAFLGSSQTERLLSTQDCAIIGVPGSSFLAAWQHFVPHGKFEPQSILLLEGNLSLNDTTEGVIEHTQEFLYQFFAQNPIFSQSARPSTMLLSQALSWMLPQAPTDSFETQAPLDERPAPSLDELLQNPHFAGQQEKLSRQLEQRISAIKEMKAAGFRPCFVFYPTRYQSSLDLALEQARLEAVRYMAKEARVPLLNYLDSNLIQQLEFSDTHHLKATHPNSSKLRNTIIRDAKELLR